MKSDMKKLCEGMMKDLGKSNIFERGGKITDILYRGRYHPLTQNSEVNTLTGTNVAMVHGYSCPRCQKNIMMCFPKIPENSLELIGFCVTDSCLQDDAQSSIQTQRNIRAKEKKYRERLM